MKKIVKKEDDVLRKIARDFVERHGLVRFLDLCQGTINKVLVKKGIITSNDLRDAYINDIQVATKKLELELLKQQPKKRQNRAK